MPAFDWDRISKVTEAALDIENANFYCDLLGDADIDSWEDLDRIKHIFYLTQAVLNLKAEQWNVMQETFNEKLSEIRSLTQQNKELESENAELQKAASGSGATRDIIQEKRAWNIEKERLESEMDGLKLYIDQTVKERDNLAGERSQLALKALEDEKNHLWLDVSRLETNLKQASVEIERATSEYTRMKDAIAEADRIYTEKASECDILRAQIANLSDQISRPSDVDDEIMNALNMKINTLKEKLAQATQDLESTTNIVEELRQDMEKSGKGSSEKQVARIKEMQRQLKDKESFIKEMKRRIQTVTII
ncbi:unnamed protein product [Protopolystoma xenopodis]|uniref:Uncharacterized protein n=1 Tax=Protopolystoma xenopodis TaxID=117903 RepID=A0A3S5CMM7_9PLAT|nr:unnamed protein product [Protopolystoma xenopodis]